MDTLLYIEFLELTDKKERVVKARNNPLEEYDDVEFKMRPRSLNTSLAKPKTSPWHARAPDGV